MSDFVTMTAFAATDVAEASSLADKAVTKKIKADRKALDKEVSCS